MLVALDPNLAEQPRAVAAALSPTLVQIGFVRLQDAAPGTVGASTIGWLVEVEVAVHRRATHPNQLGNIKLGEPRGIQGADLLVLLDLAGMLLLARGFGPLLPGDSIGIGVARQRSGSRRREACRELDRFAVAEQTAL